jgi:beta-mannosidase
MDYRQNSCSRLDLGGSWHFAWSETPPAREYTSAAAVAAAGLTGYPAAVPGNFELDLQANGLIPEPFYGMNIAALRRYEAAHIWYWTTFRGAPRPGFDAELLFEGLDCYADIYLNGQRVGSTDNMLIEHLLAVDGLLREGENELFIHIKPAIDEARKYDYPPTLLALRSNYDSLYVRKAPHMYGWDITPRALSAGLWRPIWLQYRPVERLEAAFLETLKLEKGYAVLGLHFRAHTIAQPSDICEVKVTGICGDSIFSATHRALFQAGQFSFRVENPRLWQPRGRGEANLYHVTVTLLKNGQELDHLALTHGIRTIRLERTSVTDMLGKGEFCFWVNGEKLFVKGTNWVPLDAYHSRDLTRIPQAIALAEELGCNMLRCWGGNVYENDLFYDLCDQKGILIWQDFAMACSVYPHTTEFCQRLATEARQVVRRLRQHASLALWAGDNECDQSYTYKERKRDPNSNILTRKVLPDVLKEEDWTRPYLPSSPYVDAEAYKAGEPYLTENHLWGPRDYFKSSFYQDSLCHFASEIGYHGCPSPKSLRKFLSPDKLWPYQNNEEWLLHSTSPVPGVNIYDYRVELMAKQVKELFGEIPDNLEDFAFASQVSQAEAKKFFIELFRAHKWRRTGIIWWNLLDGWPQLSDAIVDYYFEKKLAFDYIKRAQASLCLMLREPQRWGQELVVVNDTREELPLNYRVRDLDNGETLAESAATAAPEAVTVLDKIPFFASQKRFYVLSWQSPLGEGINHYLSGHPPFSLAQYRQWSSTLAFEILETAKISKK